MLSGASSVSRWHMVVLAAMDMVWISSMPILAEVHSAAIIAFNCPVMAAVSAPRRPSIEALMREITSPP